MIDRYPNSPAAADAYLLLAEAQRSEKKFAEANTTLQAFIDEVSSTRVREHGTNGDGCQSGVDGKK